MLALVLADQLGGCAGEPAPGSTLDVFAAASLTEAFTQLGRTMEQQSPQLTVRFNFAGSQQLATLIEQGARADVFASADQRWMDYAAQRMLLSDEAEWFVQNRLVVIISQASRAGIESLGDLAKADVKVVIAAEGVPLGRYSRQALEKLSAAPGFTANFAQRVTANVVSREESAKAVVAKVQLGEADAGIVYQSDVTPAVRDKVRVLDIPGPYNVAARYPIAVLRSARNPAAAHRFVDLVLSDEGQRVLREHGFVPVSARVAVAGEAR